MKNFTIVKKITAQLAFRAATEVTAGARRIAEVIHGDS